MKNQTDKHSKIMSLIMPKEEIISRFTLLNNNIG